MMAQLENDLYKSLKRINQRLENFQSYAFNVEIDDFTFPVEWQTVDIDDPKEMITGKASTRLLHRDDKQVIISNIYHPGINIKTHYHPYHHEHLHIITGSMVVNDIRVTGYLKLLANFPHRVEVDELTVVVISFERL